MPPTTNPSNGDSAPVDHVIPEGRWTFDEEITEVFDNMLTRSIPQYNVMRHAVFATGSQFVRPGSTIIDCGASRGEAIAPFIDFLEGSGRFVCIEASSPMADSLRQRFAAECAAGSLEVREKNLKDYYPDVDADLTLAVLTLQFIPIEHRQRVMRRIYEHTAPGGRSSLLRSC